MNKLIKFKKLKTLILVVMLMSGKLFAENLYAVNTKWLNTDNKETKLNVFEGHYTLITMIYTGCAHACPMTIAKVKSILKEFDAKNEKNIKVVMASFDVKNDRPEKLKSYQSAKSLDASSWSFLSAQSESAARELAVILNINYKDLGEGNFSHSNVITLLNPKGEIVSSIQSLNASASELITAFENDKKANSKK